jgi:hypothetical protein
MFHSGKKDIWEGYRWIGFFRKYTSEARSACRWQCWGSGSGSEYACISLILASHILIHLREKSRIRFHIKVKNQDPNPYLDLHEVKIRSWGGGGGTEG